MVKLRDKSKDNLVLIKALDFDKDLIKVVEILRQKRWYCLSDQIFKSGTSIGANLFEAQNAQSPKDFLSKCKIAAKESDETYYWLLVLEMTGFSEEAELLEGKLDELSRILNSIVATTTRRFKN